MSYMMKKEFIMERTICLNGTHMYKYKGNDEDILNILNHLSGSNNSVIYKKEGFRRISNLALDHGWTIIEDIKE